MRDTSRDAFKKAKEDGIIFQTRVQIKNALDTKGPMTAHECWHELRGWRALQGNARINGVTPRFSEMKRDGVVRECGRRACKITGMRCIVWESTGAPANQKLEFEVLPTKVELIRGLCEQLEIVLPKINPVSEEGKVWTSKTKTVLSQCQRYKKTIIVQ